MSGIPMYTVRAEYDFATKRWVATSEDVPGLVAETDRFEELVEVVMDLVPELLEMNGVAIPSEGVPVHLMAHENRMVRKTVT